MSAAEVPRPRIPLDLASLTAHLVGRGWGGPLPRYVITTGSTNVDLVAMLRAVESEGSDVADPAVPDWTVLVADDQNAGRGRLDREWLVPPRAALTWSMVVRPAGLVNGAWGWLPLVVGLGVVEGLRNVSLDRLALKWPNDVVVDSPGRDGVAGPRKLGGVLIERVPMRANQAPVAVVGVGLNVDQVVDELPTGTATSLRLEGRPTTRERVLADVLVAIRFRVDQWRRDGWGIEGVRRDYSKACLSIGVEVRVMRHALPDFVGRATHLDHEGALVVQGVQGSISVSAGDVLHLR